MCYLTGGGQGSSPIRGTFFSVAQSFARRKPDSFAHKLWIGTHEPLCAGLVAGAALVGIGDTLIRVFLLK